jgi:hypothetical protein
MKLMEEKCSRVVLTVAKVSSFPRVRHKYLVDLGILPLGWGLSVEARG